MHHPKPLFSISPKILSPYPHATYSFPYNYVLDKPNPLVILLDSRPVNQAVGALTVSSTVTVPSPSPHGTYYSTVTSTVTAGCQQSVR